MRVLFVSTYLGQEPLGLMWLSAALKAAGHETRLMLLPDAAFPLKLRHYDPDLVCASVTTGAHTAIAGLMSLVKSLHPRCLTIAGGPHPTVVPEYLREPGLDAICRGEGEVALVDLADALAVGGDLRHIPNIHFKDADGTIWANAPRPLEQELDRCGCPDRDLFYDASDIYRLAERKVIKTDRGCPMNCSFCFHHAWKRKVYQVTNNEYVRRRSVGHVIDEARSIQARFPLTFVHFVDDIFNINNQWLEEFAERWPREIGLPFDCIMMANMVTDRHIRLLKQAGCIQARIAFEAADDHMRNAVMRKNTTRGQLVRAAGCIKGAGLRLASLNMLGGPGASIEDDIETIRLNIECRVDHPLASLLQPYPMTDINDMTREMGVATAGWDDFSPLYNRTSAMARPDRHEFENLHKFFPLVVRHPRLLPWARRAIRLRWMSRPYTWMYMLYSEWLVTEQNTLYCSVQGKRGFRTLPLVDYTCRVFTRGFLRLATAVAGKGAARLALRARLNDERTFSHVD